MQTLEKPGAMLRKRKMPKARSWNNLTPAYRNRLERGGLSKSSYESGADLRKARGHAPKGFQTLNRDELALLNKAVRADATPQEIKKLEQFLTRPSWIPKSSEVRPEVYGALGKLPHPRTWKHVYIVPTARGPWEMTVYTKRGRYPNTIEIPGGGGAVGEAPREVIDLVKQLGIEYNNNPNTASSKEFWAVMGTDAKTPKK